MCGIFGLVNVSGTPTQNALELWEEVVRALAVYSTARGLDSAGVARLDADGTLDSTKDVGPAWTLFGRADWRRVVTPTAQTFALIGHTRQATHGGITRENSHPFTFDMRAGGQLCGVHNGVLTNHAELVAGKVPHVVDSANLFRAMARQPDWQQVWRRSVGSLAVAVLRTDDRSLTLARNHNPIALAAVKELGIVAFASTVDILENALKSCSIIARARPMPEYASIVHRVGSPKSTLTTWLDKAAAKRARAKASKTGWNERSAKGGSATVVRGGNGERWTQCGACLTWAPEQTMTEQDGTNVCARCVPYYGTRAWGPAAKAHEGDQYAL